MALSVLCSSGSGYPLPSAGHIPDTTSTHYPPVPLPLHLTFTPTRDNGGRADRQKARLIWLIEEVGFDKFAAMVAEEMGPGTQLAPAVHLAYDEPWERRDLLGVHPQKQAGLFWVGASVPAGRLFAQDFDEFAQIAETYGDGTVRLTCEENILFVNVPEAKLPEMLAEPVFLKYKVNPGGQAEGCGGDLREWVDQSG